MPKDQFAGCDGRIAIEAGSFFERVPDGCDAYLMKHIIHDWSDEHCRTILALMRKKLPKHGRVLVCEMVVTDEPGPDAGQAARHRDAGDDGGRQGAHAGGVRASCSPLAACRLSRIVPTGRPIAVIEAVPA